MDTPTQEEHWGEILERTVSKQNLMLVNVGTNGTILNHQQTFPRFYKVEPIETIKQWSHLKFRFFKKATKFKTIHHLNLRLLSKCRIKWEINSKFCDIFKRPNFNLLTEFDKEFRILIEDLFLINQLILRCFSLHQINLIQNSRFVVRYSKQLVQIHT